MPRKLLGLLSLAMAFGMLLMLFLHSELVGILIIALLIFVGYSCLFCD